MRRLEGTVWWLRFGAPASRAIDVHSMGAVDAFERNEKVVCIGVFRGGHGLTTARKRPKTAKNGPISGRDGGSAAATGLDREQPGLGLLHGSGRIGTGGCRRVERPKTGCAPPRAPKRPVLGRRGLLKEMESQNANGWAYGLETTAKRTKWGVVTKRSLVVTTATLFSYS